MSGLNEEYIISHFSEAIENGCIQPYFQPIFRSFTEKICASEALARWIDPVYGLLSPALFIPVLERYGMIYELDMAIVRQTCAFYRHLQDIGLPVHSFTVNLSRYDFTEPDFFERVVASTREFRVPQESLKLEITESIMLEDMEAFKRVFNLFHGAGFSVWMDDFGSGYSSLNTLQNYDFSTLKFDLLFLRTFSEKSRQVLAAMINMAKALRIHTICEGVETKEQVLFLRSMGCEALQGFHFLQSFGGILVQQRHGRRQRLLCQFCHLIDGQAGLFNRQRGIHFLSTAPLTDYHENDDACELANASWYDRGTPLALLEVKPNSVSHVYASRTYLDRIRQLGYPSLDELEHAFNDHISDHYLMMKRLVTDAVSNQTVQRVDYTNNGVSYRLRARCLAKEEGKAMLALQLRTFQTEKEAHASEEMLQYGNALFSTCELVSVIYPDRDSSERIYSRESILSYASVGKLRESFQRFCSSEIHPDDQERYRRFSDLDSLDERLESGFIQSFFRMTSSAVWRSIRISRMPSDKERVYLYTIQALPDQEMRNLDTFVREHPNWA